MTYQNPSFGEVVNGRMWDGTEWVPVEGLKPGDQINDHMWTGTHWVEMNPKPAPKQKSLWRMWWFWLMITIVALAAIGTIGEEAPASPPPATAQQSAPEAEVPDKAEQLAPEPAEPKVPDGAVVDDDLAFTILDVETDVTTVNGPFRDVEALEHASFTVVEFEVENISNKPQEFSWSNTRGTDTLDRELHPDAAATIYANDKYGAIGDLNPGTTFKLKVVFNIEDDQQLKTITFHDSSLSKGATVTL